MKTTESTIVQLKRFFNKVSQKFPSTEEPVIMTDIHLSVSQDTGELLALMIMTMKSPVVLSINGLIVKNKIFI